MKNKKKAFVLPTVIVSMLVLSLVSLLMLSAVITTKLNTGILMSRSETKLDLEKIYFDFKNNQVQTYSNYEVTTYSASNLDESSDTEYKAIVVSKNEKTLLFAVCEFKKDDSSLKSEINFQTNDFLFEFEKLEDETLNKNKLTFGSLIFTVENAG